MDKKETNNNKYTKWRNKCFQYAARVVLNYVEIGRL